ncbi:hypothetical protein GS429_11640 [Natronorubrum sp. JWXQ-INN-674]|uniref:SHOCT domain-containing protein n=1 Tax=Natronorubrum halalkaliphilum TaxID=2691917 RepID=A0A6B0VMC0_9EURY|nr:hypothetical protein [Natronorubrum halalkaliphilum]MXV62704.1 hypothetical protein [Natronorubrum halalkaliphilum]
MVHSWLLSNAYIEDVGDLAILVSLPSLVVISLLWVLGFSTLATVVSIFVFIGVLPILLLFGDSILARSRDEEQAHDPLENLNNLYAEGELTREELEREVERELSDTPNDHETDSSPEKERISESERS